MVERVYRPKPGDDPSAPMGLMRGMFDPSLAGGFAIKGSSGTKPVNIGGLLTKGGEYGLTAWDDMFDEQGNLMDEQAFMRSMNLGSIMREGMKTGKGAGDESHWDPWAVPDYMGFGSSDSPTSPYATGRHFTGRIEDPLVAWLHGLGYQGVDKGVNWLGRTRKDIPGQWYNPESLWFTGEGMDLGSATQQSLEQWAMDNYGVGLQNLAAWNPEVHDTMKSWTADPTQWWNPDLHGLDVTNIPGMGGIASEAGMSAFAEAYEQGRQGATNRSNTALRELQQRAMMGDPQGYGRSAMGHGLGNQIGYGSAMGQGIRGMAAPPMDYSGGMAMHMAPYQQMRALEQYWNQYAQ